MFQLHQSPTFQTNSPSGVSAFHYWHFQSANATHPRLYSLSMVEFPGLECVSVCVYVCVRLLGAPGQKRPVSQFVLDADSGPPGARRSPVYLPANERQ